MILTIILWLQNYEKSSIVFINHASVPRSINMHSFGRGFSQVIKIHDSEFWEIKDKIKIFHPSIIFSTLYFTHVVGVAGASISNTHRVLSSQPNCMFLGVKTLLLSFFLWGNSRHHSLNKDIFFNQNKCLQYNRLVRYSGIKECPLSSQMGYLRLFK